MSAGKSTENKLMHRLDALTPPAGSVFDKAAAWNKLNARMNESKLQPPYIIRGWWAAAALVLIFPAYLLLQHNNDSSAPFSLAGSIKPVTAVQQSIATLPLAHPPEHISGTNISYVKNTAKPPVQHAAFNDSSKITDSSSRTIIDQRREDTFVAHNRQPPPVPVKKKLSVVYYNEIVRTEQVEASPATGSSTTISVPGFNNPDAGSAHKAVSDEPSAENLKNRWLPFNKSAKPKE
jgi:hypothetical protein